MPAPADRSVLREILADERVAVALLVAVFVLAVLA